LQRARIALAAAAAVAAGADCAKLPEGRTAIDAVSVRGTEHVAESDVQDQIATTASPKFLGLFRGVYDYEIFDPTTLQRDLARVERYYRAKGYYGAHARAGRSLATSNGHVRVEIVVEEGEPVLAQEVTVVGLDGLPEGASRAALAAARRAVRRGRPFDEDRFTEGEARIQKELTDRGYAWAKVSSEAWVDVVHHAARARYTVDAGPTATFGAIAFEGLDTKDGRALPRDQLLRTIEIERGEPYSTKAIDAASQALLDLGIFASVDIEPALGERPAGAAGARPEVPLTVRLELGRLREIRLGGGVELDPIKTDLHGLAGWRDRNFLGGLRDFSIEARPGVVLYPTRIDNPVLPDRWLPV
jgi:outer membrane protein insertion porin family/translocation and assembly module TamA